eukprot:gene33076-40819_t
MSTEVIKYIQQSIAGQLIAMFDFGNGRDVDNYFKKVFMFVASRCVQSAGCALEVTKEDLDQGLKELLKTKSATNSKPSSVPKIKPTAPTEKPKQQQQYAFAKNTAPPKMNTVATTLALPEEEEEEAMDEEVEEEVQVEQTVSTVKRTIGFGQGGDNMEFLLIMQTMLRAQGLETQDGVGNLSGMSMSDPEMGQYITEIMRQMGLSREGAVDLLLDWQTKQGEVQDILRDEKNKEAKAKAENKKIGHIN